MPGLAPYIRTLSIGQRTKIDARGTTVFLRLATGEIRVTARSTQVGQGEHGGQGVAYTLRMTEAEKWFTAEEFDSVEVENTAGIANSIELYIGYGDFSKPVPDIVNVSIGVPAGRVITTAVDETNIDVGQAGKVLLDALDLTRTGLIITALASNTDPIRIGDTNVDINRGIPLAAGETINVQNTGAVFACSQAVVNQGAAITVYTTV